MSRILFHDKIILLSFFSIIFAKTINPVQIDLEETLTIYSKDRSYYNLTEDSLTYYVQGPRVVSIHSRLAFPSLTKKIKPYKFKVIIDEVDSFNVSHHFKKDPNVFARMHPRHSHTQSGVDVINIPKGNHRIDLISLDSSLNLNIRMVSKPFKKIIEIDQPNLVVANGDKLNDRVLKVGDKNIKYFSLSEDEKLFFSASGPSAIKIISRTTFEDDDEKRDYYQFKIRKNNKLASTHHMFSDLSSGASIRKSNLGVSKFKTTYLFLPSIDDEDQYEIQAVYPKTKETLFKIVQGK